MPASPARAAAFEILQRVEREQSYASELLHSARFAKLTASDHGLTTELVMGVLRWRSLLDQRLAGSSSQELPKLDREVLTALRLGAYQLHFLSRIPARAAMFESVELVKTARKRSAATFVNAVLRKVARAVGEDPFEAISRSVDAASLTERSAHPEWLIGRWIERYGLAAARQVCLYNQTVPATAIHCDDVHAAESLIAEEIQLSPGLLLTSARRVQAGDVTKTRAYREGRVSIQDEASQLVALLVGRGEKILDCCAAPGSKTSLLAKRNPQARVFALELYPHRARLLRRLAAQATVRVVAADARQLPFTCQFDRILVDVPCSGTGTLARNPEIKWRLTPGDLRDLQSRQVAILKSALSRLSVSGRLVYSTCSLEPEENEAVVEAALRGSSEFKLVDCREELTRLRTCGELAWGNLDSLLSGSFLRTVPGVHPCDGFFVAIVERTA